MAPNVKAYWKAEWRFESKVALFRRPVARESAFQLGFHNQSNDFCGSFRVLVKTACVDLFGFKM